SFREIDESVNVKSSSILYYFRLKEDLAFVVAERYREDFFQVLGPAPVAGKSPRDQFLRYGEVYLKSFKSSGKACLCGILSHESPALPEPVISEVERFIDANIIWLKETLAGSHLSDTEGIARLAYSSMEGAMGVATLKSDPSWLVNAREQIARLFPD
ncbi:MAG: hypothetical protein AAF733_11225, partial [Verrucomicrobiota bacterium]